MTVRERIGLAARTFSEALIWSVGIMVGVAALGGLFGYSLVGFVWMHENGWAGWIILALAGVEVVVVLAVLLTAAVMFDLVGE
jgi:phosphotransferase system  glucose/maltose/N-acetylglucosamine-specific IIC component